MFAPPVAKPKTKPAASSNNKFALGRSTPAGHRFGDGTVEQVRLLQWSIGNQAVPQFLAQRASVSRNEPGPQEEADAAHGQLGGSALVGFWKNFDLSLRPGRVVSNAVAFSGAH